MSALHLPRLGSVDTVGLEAHAASLGALELGDVTRLRALQLVVRLLDVAPAGTGTPASARELCADALRTGIAAVCVPPGLVPLCRERLAGSAVRVSCPGPAAGTQEIELPFDTAALLAGDEVAAFYAIRDAAGAAPLKVALDAPSLGSYEALRRAALLAIAAGAGFVSAAPLPAALCVLEVIRDVHEETGHVVGFKAPGAETLDDALQELVLVHETLGPDWLVSDRLRIGVDAGVLRDICR